MGRIAQILVTSALCLCASVVHSARAQSSQPSTNSKPAEPMPLAESPQDRAKRMAWFNDARFGMFIHWGLYAVPGGEWGERKNHGEWIRTTAQIPLDEYGKLREKFNPVKFDAEQWVRMARDAGMKYIVITSKHHDGFCLFDSKQTEFDVMSTPFKRDILKELSDACKRGGIRLCFYHSIMDWNHPDYLPRRDWEKSRSAEGADFDRYVTYMKNQLKELITSYGPLGILWFDGEWESTWTHPRGVDLYNYVRGLQPDIIVNNRVDVGRDGMAGMSTDPRFAGDYGTPEQEIPPTGMPGVAWETCMTMNDHWGWNKHDKNWKSTEQLIRMLVDIASKGGNFLLNVGPTETGEFPPEAVQRLAEIGRWMRQHGEAIYGAAPSPFKSTPWGRCTVKPGIESRMRLYLHVFDWPTDRALAVHGLANRPKEAFLFTQNGLTPLETKRIGDAVIIGVPEVPPDPYVSVIALDVVGHLDIITPPVIAAESDIFVDSLDVTIAAEQQNVEVRYALAAAPPTKNTPLYSAPIKLNETTTISARTFRAGKPVSEIVQKTFNKVEPRAAVDASGAKPGLAYDCYLGRWDVLPEFNTLTPARSGVVDDFDLSARTQDDKFALRFRGLITVPETGIYRFFTRSDDGSRLYIGDQLVVDNDGPHGMKESAGVIALAKGAHPITVAFFERDGQEGLEVWYSGPSIEKQRVPKSALSHTATRP